jgi:hypothetical protein
VAPDLFRRRSGRVGNDRALSTRFLIGAAVVVAVAAFTSGCGGSTSGSSAPTGEPETTSAAPSTGTVGAPSGSAQNPGALTEEAQQAAAGDIPDNQVFLVFRNTAGGYSMKYPEGWARNGSAGLISFRDKNNLVRVAVVNGASTTVAAATAEMHRLKTSTPSLRFGRPTPLTIDRKHTVKVVYTTRSKPNPVTGKSVTLYVDRYYVPGAAKHAVVDLATPHGVDNVDAYKLMIESFRWK